MYMMPYGKDLFDDIFDPVEKLLHSGTLLRPHSKSVMNTDVVERNDGIELIMDLPGVNKENIKIELEEGYIHITASSDKQVEEKDNNGKYLRKERQCGKYSRSFYVGENITEEDVKASFKDGVLTLKFPKNEDKKIEQKKSIFIEG